MGVQFAQPYRFSGQQLACMAAAGVVPGTGTELMDGVPYWAGSPVRFSSDAYSRLGEIGVIARSERVELVDGEIVAMSPEGSRHSACVSRLARLLIPCVGDALVTSRDSLRLPDGYRPAPDLLILHPPEDEHGISPAHETLVVIEVADASIQYDLLVKAPRYAQAGIPEYWLVDLTRDAIAVHQQPAPGEYRDVRAYGPGDVWTSEALAGLMVPVDAVLKPRT